MGVSVESRIAEVRNLRCGDGEFDQICMLNRPGQHTRASFINLKHGRKFRECALMNVESTGRLLAHLRAARVDKDNRWIAAGNQQSICLQACRCVVTEVRTYIRGECAAELAEARATGETGQSDIDQQLGTALDCDLIPVGILGDLSDELLGTAKGTYCVLYCGQFFFVDLCISRRSGVLPHERKEGLKCFPVVLVELMRMDLYAGRLCVYSVG